MAIQVLQTIAVLGTIVTGMISMVRPLSIKAFTGLEVSGARGITEIRAVLGGAFVGLGIAPLLFNARAAYQTLGITYLVIGITRAVSIIIDRSTEKSNFISLIVEIIFGVLLML